MRAARAPTVPTKGSASRSACSTVCLEGRAAPWRFPSLCPKGPPAATPTAGASSPTGLPGRARLLRLRAPQLCLRPPRGHSAPRRRLYLPLRSFLLSYARFSGLSFPVCAARCGRPGMAGNPIRLKYPNLFSPGPPSQDAPAEMRVLRALSSGHSSQLHCPRVEASRSFVELINHRVNREGDEINKPQNA